MAGAIAIAIGVWWNANTVSHIFIHRPFFRRGAANAWCAALLTVLLGIPQSLWRDRHLAHHRGTAYRFRLTREIAAQAALVASIWLVIALSAPAFFVGVYIPGYVLGLLMCAVHGHYEHAGGTTSHYGRLYNALCFNDGYHVEHHRHPSASWSTLPAHRDRPARSSVWPAPLRWLEPGLALTALERLVLRSLWLQRWVVRSHAQALEKLLAGQPTAGEIAIVGGGLFPRSAIVLRRLLPRARITIVDANEAHLDRARSLLRDDSIEFVHARFDPKSSESELNLQCELLVIPLSFNGDRSALYRQPPAPTVIVHDWIWRRRGTSRIVSSLLLKRINLVHG